MAMIHASREDSMSSTQIMLVIALVLAMASTVLGLA
jgi:hypothetical protein